MKINWKLRLQNKVTLTTLCVSIVTCVYAVLAALGIAPSIAEEQVLNLVMAVIAMLTSIGIVVDPTTEGFGDSDRALEYDCPACDEGEE